MNQQLKLGLLTGIGAFLLYDQLIKEHSLSGNVFWYLVYSSFAFFTMIIQMLNSGYGPYPSIHKLIGYFSTVSVFLGVFYGYLIYVDISNDPKYEIDGKHILYAYYFMACVILIPATIGFSKGMEREFESHIVWFIRSLGALWGSFWANRITTLLSGQLLQISRVNSLLIGICSSCMVGMLFTEFVLGLDFKKESKSTKNNKEKAL